MVTPMEEKPGMFQSWTPVIFVLLLAALIIWYIVIKVKG